MSKRVLAVLVGTLLALVAASLWVPVRTGTRLATWPTADRSDEPVQFIENYFRGDAQALAHGEVAYVTPLRGRTGYRYRTVWALDELWGIARLLEVAGVDGAECDAVAGDFVQWRILLATHSLILLLGGGLMAFTVRRARRRQAGP